MITITTPAGKKMTLTDSALEWKKEEFEAQYGTRDENGNLAHNPDFIYKQVQEVKKQIKANAEAKKTEENAVKEAKRKNKEVSEKRLEAHKKAKKSDKKQSSESPKSEN